MAELLRIRGRDPLLFRDGRPFAADAGGLSARSLPLPLPSTVAGVVRERYGQDQGWSWTAAQMSEARSVAVAGPLLVRYDSSGDVEKILVIAPADIVPFLRDPSDPQSFAWMALRPADLPAGQGSWPDASPQVLQVPQEVKPVSAFRYWTWDAMCGWLEDESNPPECEPEPGPGREERVHVKIDPSTGAADEGMLFATSGLALGETWSFLARVPDGVGSSAVGLGPMGGERRLAWMEPEANLAWPGPPGSLAGKLAALEPGQGIRMLLVSPALFQGGWRPGWLGDDDIGSPPAPGGTLPLRLKLVSAAVPRREAVSGWDLEARGPKAVRWMVPAGSVYFFTLVDGDPGVLGTARWLEPVCDGDQDCRDGFGLAIWGLW